MLRHGRSSAVTLVAMLGVAVCRGAPGATIEEQPPPNGCEPLSASSVAASPVAPGANFPPPQLEIFTPFEPTAFPSAGRSYVVYELHLRSFTSRPFAVSRVDVIDAESGAALATFDAERLTALFQPRGPQASAGPDDDGTRLGANEGVIAFLCLAFPGTVPSKLSHHVHTDAGVAEGPVIGTGHGELRTFGPPVAGSNWQASSAPSNDSHHRAGLVVFDGRAQISRRYAIDWLQLEDGAAFAGDEGDPRSHHAHGEDVLAVGDGTVVAAVDGLPDNLPRTAAGFTPAVPMTRATIGGNGVVIDLGGGQFASYSHLQAGSLRVKQGDRVRRGQRIARIGNSGDARAPHLHFQITTTPDLFAAEGVPYVIDEYRVQLQDGAWERRTNELPLSGMLIDFGSRRGK